MDAGKGHQNALRASESAGQAAQHPGVGCLGVGQLWGLHTPKYSLLPSLHGSRGYHAEHQLQLCNSMWVITPTLASAGK